MSRCVDLTPGAKSLYSLTWLPELTSLQPEPTNLDGLIWQPEPTSLDKLMRQNGSTQLPVDVSRWVDLAARADMSRRVNFAARANTSDGWTLQLGQV